MNSDSKKNPESNEPKTVSALSDETSAVQGGNPQSEPVRKSLFSANWEPGEDETDIREYRSVSLTAIAAFVFGLLSFLGFLYKSCLVLSIFGIVFSLLACFFIARSQGTVLGRSLALFALSCSLICLTGVSSMWTYYEFTVKEEARRFCRIWFNGVRDKNIKFVMDMESATWYRKHDMSEEDWWRSKLVVEGPIKDSMEMFISSLNEKCFKTLWVLGDNAKFTYYKTDGISFHDSQDSVAQTYAVTFNDEQGKTKTFFIKFHLKRVLNHEDESQRGWMLIGNPKLADLPVEFGGTPKDS